MCVGAPNTWCAVETPATITSSICAGSAGAHTCGGGGRPTVSDIGSQRMVYDGVGGSQYIVKIGGTNIPASTNESYLPGNLRKIYWVTYYEDRGRDDTDGPGCCDEVDIGYTACCATPGSVCPAVCQ